MDLRKDVWTDDDYVKFQSYLESLGDNAYKAFNSRIIPNTPQMYGIRIPILRKLANEISKGNARGFIVLNKGKYHEECILDGIVMSQIKCSYDEMLIYMKQFTDEIYNWAICDSVSFKEIKNHRAEFFNDIEWFIYNKNPWAVRFGLLCLMKFYLDDEYTDRVFKYVNSINSDFYYIEMMQAWLIATAAAQNIGKTISFLKANSLNDFTQNAAIQKIRDSYRVSKEDKAFVKKLKRQILK